MICRIICLKMRDKGVAGYLPLIRLILGMDMTSGVMVQRMVLYAGRIGDAVTRIPSWEMMCLSCGLVSNRVALWHMAMYAGSLFMTRLVNGV